MQIPCKAEQVTYYFRITYSMSGISESFRADRLVRAATSPAIIDENLRPLRASLDDGIDGKERVIEKPPFPTS